MHLASTSLKVFFFVQGGWFQTVFRDCESLRPNGNRLSWHYGSLAPLALRCGAFSAWAEVLDIKWSLFLYLPLLALFQVHLLSFISPSKFPIQISFWQLCSHSCVPPFWPLQWSVTILISLWPTQNINSAESVFPVLKPSKLRWFETMVGSEIGNSWTSCSSTNRADSWRKTDGRREIPEEDIVGGVRTKSTEITCRFGDGRPGSTAYHGINCLAYARFLRSEFQFNNQQN